jgi:DNA-directed RNA polymerase subunit RPC12/RpoP
MQPQETSALKCSRCKKSVSVAEYAQRLARSAGEKHSGPNDPPAEPESMQRQEAAVDDPTYVCLACRAKPMLR